MQFEEETLEILEPNAAMSPILKALDAALAAHTGPDPQPRGNLLGKRSRLLKLRARPRHFLCFLKAGPKALFPQQNILRAICCMNCPRTLTS